MTHARSTPFLALAALALGLLAGCASPLRGSNPPPDIAVTISPTSAILSPGQQQQFEATVTGTANGGVTWAATGGAVVGQGSSVSYVAPAAVGSYQVTAASAADPSKTATAMVTVEPAKPPLGTVWTEQFGWEGFDDLFAVAVDANGNVVVAGSREPAPSGPDAPGRDALVRKYEAGGDLVWESFVSTSGEDAFRAVAVDERGYVTAAGYSPSAAGAVDLDALYRVYTSDGAPVRTVKFGSSGDDVATGVAIDADGNVVVVGSTTGALHPPQYGEQDAFVRKYDAEDNVLWSYQFGAPGWNAATGVALDRDGNVLVTGIMRDTQGDPGGPAQDAFVRKYSPDGALLWADRFGTGEPCVGLGVAVDAHGNVLVVGRTHGDLAAGQAGAGDAFVRQYAPDGEVRWTDQFGTTGEDSAEGVVVAPDGGFFLVGSTGGVLGEASAGSTDVFVRKYGADGKPEWTHQFGSAKTEYAAGIGLDAAGNVLVVGTTYGDLGGANAGYADAFIRKLAR